VYGFIDGIGRIKGIINCVKVGVERYESIGKVGGDVRGGAHNELVGKSEDFDNKELDKVKEVRMLPNDITSVHWLIVQVSLFFFLYAFVISWALPKLSSGIHSLLAEEYLTHDMR
jgi:hypothetical protein